VSYPLWEIGSWLLSFLAKPEAILGSHHAQIPTPTQSTQWPVQNISEL